MVTKTKLCPPVEVIAARKGLDRFVVPLTFLLVHVSVLFGAFNLVFWQNQLWELFARHTTMTLIILYLVYSQVSTVVSAIHKQYRVLTGNSRMNLCKYSNALQHFETV